MIRTARPLLAALFVMAPLHVGCGTVLGYEDDYGLGGTSAGGSGGDRAGSGGSSAGASVGGSANNGGMAQGGTAGTSQGGSAGTSQGGSAGATQGGSAGTTQGGNAGTTQGGNAGTTQGGTAGTTQGGTAGTTQGGTAGATQGGSAGTTQGGTAGTTQGGAGGGVAGSGGSGPINPTDCSVLYVSPGAKTDGDGCSPAAPVRTLASALLLRQAKTTEIRICQGTVDTSTVQLNAPISLKGSYDCATWTRPSPLAVETLSTIVKSSVEGAAVVVSTAAVGRSTVIEGIHFIGASIGKKSRAFAVTGGAKPTVRFNHIQGGKGVGPDFPALGMQVSAGAAPRLEGNLIESGEGDTDAASVASVALLLSEDAGPAEIVGNTIRGGKATLHGKGYGSVGLFVLPLSTASLTGDAAIRDNVISGGDGNDVMNLVEFLSVGVFLDETSAGSRGNFQFVGGSIRGANASHSGAPSSGRIPSAIGLHSGKHIKLEIDNVRLYGGDSSELTGSGIAVSLGGPGATFIRSSVLHGGGATDTTPSPRAIETRQSGRLTVFGSTLFAGLPRTVSGGSASAKGIYASGDGALDLRGNLFVFLGGQATAIQLEETCALPPSGDSVLSNNGFVFSRKTDQELLSGKGCGVGTGSTIASLSAVFPTNGANVRVAPDASAPSDVATSCSGDVACVKAALQDYESSTSGRSQVLALDNGAFAPKLCALTKGNAINPDNATDLFGKLRPANGAIGAIEPQGLSLCP